MKKTILAAAILLFGYANIGNSNKVYAQTYCNPLPMEIGNGGNAAGDVTVIEEGGKYYMYCTGGGAWVSEDLVNWDFHAVAGVPVAPDVVKYNGKFYLSGNNDNLFVADNPLGPFKDLGPFSNTGPVENGWNGGFDTKIFIDDDNQPYLFWPGRGISGIYGVKLDPNDLTRFMDKPTHLFGFNPMHAWERYGEMNEYPGVAWIEGPWIIKRNGIYYLEYSASGTQWKTYAEGYYTATSPLGPYSYAPNNPLLRKTEGLVTGTAHGSIVKGPDDNLWQFYTIVLSNPPGGRRIGMDKVVFDDEGLMSVTVTDTPQPAPLAKGKNLVAEAKADGNIAKANAEGNTAKAKTEAAKAKAKTVVPKIVPVTINKMKAMNALSTVSSEQTGFPAAYAVDNYSGTIWKPTAEDKQPSITIELSPATRFDVVQFFTVSSLRILFGNGEGRWFGFRAGSPLPVYKYMLEVSNDGKTFTKVLDKTNNEKPKDTVYDEFEPINCRFVRLTVTEWPKDTQLGIIDFTVFGYPDGWEPAAVATPTYFNLPLDSDETRPKY